MPETEADPLAIPREFNLSGAMLATATQALLYKGIRAQDKTELPERTKTNIELAREAAHQLSGRIPTDATVWTSISKDKDLSRNVKAFLWKCVHNAHKCGPYWQRIPKYEERAICSACDGTEIESINHILFECQYGVQSQVWKLAKEMLRMKKIDWPQNMGLGHVLACQLANLKDEHGAKRRGASRLFRIVVSECAYLIWKLRCERLFDRLPDEPEREISSTEVINRVTHTLNTRLAVDRILTDSRRFGKQAIRDELVLQTWSGTLKNEQNLPPDGWIRWKSGVLVGITPDRPNGRNR